MPDRIAKLRALLPDEDGCATGAVAAGAEWCRECGTADALRNAAPELLAVVEAGQRSRASHCDCICDDGDCGPCDERRARDALDAKLREVLP